MAAPRQFKAIERGVTLSVEAARGQGRRQLIAVHSALTIKLPIPNEIDEERLLPIMTAKLEREVYRLLENLTAPKH